MTAVNLPYYKKTKHYVICQLCKLILTLHKRNEITLVDKNLMRPKFTQIGRVHGLPKIHKNYQDIPPF